MYMFVIHLCGIILYSPSCTFWQDWQNHQWWCVVQQSPKSKVQNTQGLASTMIQTPTWDVYGILPSCLVQSWNKWLIWLREEICCPLHSCIVYIEGQEWVCEHRQKCGWSEKEHLHDEDQNMKASLIYVSICPLTETAHPYLMDPDYLHRWPIVHTGIVLCTSNFFL